MDPEVDSTGRLSQASSEMLFGALLQQTQDQVYFKDKRSRFVKASDAVVEKLGAKSMDDLIGKSDFDFFAAEHAQRTFDAEQRLMTEGKRLTNITEKEIWPDGTVTWATSTKIPLYLGEGNLVGLMGITRDITDRVKAEQALEESRELLRRKNEVMETDLENARRIQKSLIPGPIPNLYFAEVGVVNQAMMDVCGDVITFPEETDESLSFLLGDVAGHGVTAGLFTILVKHLADCFESETFDDLGNAMVNLDQHLQGLIPNGYVAVTLGRLKANREGSGATLSVANAGGASALLYRAATGEVSVLELPSENVIGLGICEGAESVKVELAKDDLVLLFTDGVIECRNSEEAELGMNGLAELFMRVVKEPAAELVVALRDLLSEYAGGHFPQDDTTLLALRVR